MGQIIRADRAYGVFKSSAFSCPRRAFGVSLHSVPFDLDALDLLAEELTTYVHASREIGSHW